MTSQRVERTWIRTGGYRPFRGEWVKVTTKVNLEKKCLQDPDMFWDFITLRPETTHQVCFLFSDRGIPDGYQHMNGYGSHTFKLLSDKGDAVYCKFHVKVQCLS